LIPEEVEYRTYLNLFKDENELSGLFASIVGEGASERKVFPLTDATPSLPTTSQESKRHPWCEILRAGNSSKRNMAFLMGRRYRNWQMPEIGT